MIFEGAHIDAIVFDLGGVILNIDYQLPVKAFSRLGVDNFNERFSQAIQSSLFDDYETGRISSDAFLDSISREVRPGTSREALIGAWNSILLDLPEERLFMLEKAAQDHRIFLLSNTNDLHIRSFNSYLRNAYNMDSLAALFDKLYYSYEVGLRKPDRRIFEYVVQDAGLEPSTTLFIDDSIQHIVSAKETGLHTHHLRSGSITELLRDLL